jgi:hypothetical protein
MAVYKVIAIMLFAPPPAAKQALVTTLCSRVSRFSIATFGSVLLAVNFVHAVKPADGIAPIHRAEKPIKDGQGRIEMIVDFDFEPHKDTEFAPRASPEDEKKWDKHQGKVVNLLNQYEKKYEFSRSGMTSWVKISATAFLTPEQIEQLSRDKRVTLLIRQ